MKKYALYLEIVAVSAVIVLLVFFKPHPLFVVSYRYRNVHDLRSR